MTKPLYDLEERTAVFGEKVIDFCKVLPRNDITKPIINQLIRAATSVGANYCEANDACSKKDFVNKISITKKESREAMHWLRMIGRAVPDKKILLRCLWQEAHELNLIFATIIRKTKENMAIK